MEELRMVPIASLRESATNPRRCFKHMEELTESVKEKGVLVPLLVRPVNGHMEIIAGARRYRAAREARRRDIPVIVKDVSDDEALEIQVLENLQREDIHQLDEALGYKALLARPGYDVAAIAAKVSKDESYIYKRLKLADLIPSVQEAFLQDRITPGHALLIARLQPKDQEKAFEQCFRRYDNRLLETEDLKSWISWNVHLELAGVPFKLADADLVPEAGSCVECPKRTGFNTLLFADIDGKDSCTDGACYKKKVQAHINREIARQQEKGKDLLKVSSDWSGKKDGPIGRNHYELVRGKEDKCEHAQKAIVVSGKEDKGKILTVCAAPDCKIHKKQRQASPSNAIDWEAQHKREEERAEKERRIRMAVFEAVLTLVQDPDRDWTRDDWNLVARTLVGAMNAGELDILGRRRSLKDAKATDKKLQAQIPSMDYPELLPFIIECCLVPCVPVSWYSKPQRPAIFLETAARFGVDIKAIEKRIAGELRQEKKPKDSKKSKPKAKKAKSSQASDRSARMKKYWDNWRKKKAKATVPEETKPAAAPDDCDRQCYGCDREDCKINGREA